MTAAQHNSPQTEDDSQQSQLQIWMNGKLVPKQQAVVSIFDHGLLYGDGVFEGIRVYNGTVFKCKSHLDRLFASAQTVRLVMHYTHQQLRDAIYQTLKANGITNGYIRLCVTRGMGTLGLNPLICKGGTTFIIADQIALYPQELYEQGLKVITAKRIRNHPDALPPTVKSMNYLNNILAKIEAIDAGVLEAIMLNHEGYVGECTGDNVFGVRDGKLVRPPLSAGMLDGITMKTVEQLAADLGIEVNTQNLLVSDLIACDEMFLTGTAAEVIPVTTIDDKPVGDGQVGPITKTLIATFRKLVSQDVPED